MIITCIVNISLYRKLAEVEIIGSPEASESVLNKINTEHVTCQQFGVWVWHFLLCQAEKTASVNKLFTEVDEKRKVMIHWCPLLSIKFLGLEKKLFDNYVASIVHSDGKFLIIYVAKSAMSWWRNQLLLQVAYRILTPLHAVGLHLPE